MKKYHRTSRAVFLFCFCCDARSMQATFADLKNANVWTGSVSKLGERVLRSPLGPLEPRPYVAVLMTDA